LGVQEYFLYDPTAEYLQPSLRAFEWSGGGYVPMQPTKEEVDLGVLAFVPGEGEPPEFISQHLGLRVTLDEANQIQFYDIANGKRLLSDEEARREAEAVAQSAVHLAEQEGQRAAAEAQRADQEAQRATMAAERATQAEAENTGLRAELAKLRGD